MVAQKILLAEPVGSFFVRFGKKPGNFQLVVKAEKENHKIRIEFTKPYFQAEASNEKFFSVQELVVHYKTNPLPGIEPHLCLNEKSF